MQFAFERIAVSFEHLLDRYVWFDDDEFPGVLPPLIFSTKSRMSLYSIPVFEYTLGIVFPGIAISSKADKTVESFPPLKDR